MGHSGHDTRTMGRTAEALTAFRKTEQSHLPAPMQAFIEAWKAMPEGNCRKSLAATEKCIEHYLDPEDVFYMSLIMARLGETERALSVLSESMDRGFSSVHVLQRNPWFDSLRSTTEFQKLLRRANACLAEAKEIYLAAGGPQLLGK